jgi:hypothetical protein
MRVYRRREYIKVVLQPIRVSVRLAYSMASGDVGSQGIGIADEPGLHFQFDVDAGSAGAVVRFADFAAESGVECEHRDFLSWLGDTGAGSRDTLRGPAESPTAGAVDAASSDRGDSGPPRPVREIGPTER